MKFVRKEIPRNLHYQKNIYACKRCLSRIVTVDRDAGTTPFGILCKVAGCGGTAYSQYYRVPQDMAPTHEWYRPDLAELRAIALHDVATLEHVLKGGLLLRPIPAHYADLPPDHFYDWRDGRPVDQLPEEWPITKPAPEGAER